MKQLLLTLIIFILMTTFVYGQSVQSVYVGVDPDSEVSEYIIEFDGNNIGPMMPVSVEPTVTKVMDIAPFLVVNEMHVIRLKALNEWGDESEYSVPFDFIPRTGGGVTVRGTVKVPATIRLLSE